MNMSIERQRISNKPIMTQFLFFFRKILSNHNITRDNIDQLSLSTILINSQKQSRFLSLVIYDILALLALLMCPEIARNSCLRHAFGNYFELNF